MVILGYTENSGSLWATLNLLSNKQETSFEQLWKSTRKFSSSAIYPCVSKYPSCYAPATVLSYPKLCPKLSHRISLSLWACKLIFPLSDENFQLTKGKNLLGVPGLEWWRQGSEVSFGMTLPPILSLPPKITASWEWMQDACSVCGTGI